MKMVASITNRGSEWRKWDLHIHSCYSVLNNNYTHNSEGKIDDESVREFIQTLKENEISAIGLTNYFQFSDDDFNLKNKLEDAGIATFLNLEIRLSNINKNDELFDYHIIFDNKLDNKIIKDLLANLKANVGATKKSFTQLSKNEIEHTASIDFGELIKTLKGEGNQVIGKYMLGFLSRGHGSATSDSDPKNMSVYEHITSKSNFLVHASTNLENLANDREYWLHHKLYPRPLIQSSDAHDLEKIGKQYSWIKADTTFEGLRQILFEPEDRISLQIDKPERKNDYQVIDYIKFDDDKTLFLNPNLNTIIGGRSMGKSTLSNSIAKKLHNSGCDIEKMHTYHETDDETLKIIWKDGIEDDNREIEFLPQNHMIDLAEDSKKRKILIDSIIRSKDQGAQYQEISEYNVKVSNNKSKISAQLREYFDAKDKLFALIKPEGDEKGILAEIKKLTNEQREKRKENNFSDEDAQKYDELLEQLSGQEKIKKSVEKNLEDLENLALSSFSLNKDTVRFNKDFAKILSEKLQEIEERVKAEWLKIVSELVQAEETKKEDSIKEIREIQESQAYIKGKENISNNASLKGLTDKLKTENESLENLKKYKKDKSDLEKEILEKEKDILASYDDYKKFREELENKFNIKTEKVEIKLVFKPEEFSGEILNARTKKALTFIEEFNEDSSDKIKHIFDNLDLAYNGKNTQDDLIRTLLSKDWYTYNFLLEYDGDDFDKMSQGKKAFVVLNLILEFSDDKKPVIIDQPEDSLDNRAIYKDLTEYLIRKKKERQIILITHNPNVVVGADAENIIIANKHSETTPNENCREFDYLNGALESIEADDEDSTFTLLKQSVRDHMFEILEGGKEAFEKRENKYNL